MMVLAVESATETAGVALADESGVLASATVGRGRRHAESVVPAVDFVCRRAGVALGAVDGFVVDVGPGLFTGLRVGVASARALAFALDRPLVGVGSLSVLAGAVAEAGPARPAQAPGAAPGATVAAVVDARRGEVFAALFAAAGTAAGAAAATADGTADGTAAGWALEVQGEEMRRTPEAMAAELAALTGSSDPGGPTGSVVVAGTGARRYAELFSSVPGVTVAGPGFDHPSPGLLARMGLARLAAGGAARPEAVLPRYLRDADVRINWERRERRARAGA